MTIPALVNRTQGKELETSLKKSYSVLQNAFNQMSYDEGQTINRANYGPHTLMPVLKKYFKVSKDCNLYGCASGNLPETGGYRISDNYKTYNNTQLAVNLFDDGQVIVSDGMFIMIENIGGPLLITVDTNGYNKNLTAGDTIYSHFRLWTTVSFSLWVQKQQPMTKQDIVLCPLQTIITALLAHTKHSLTKIILKIFQNKIFTISLINFKKNIFMI